MDDEAYLRKQHQRKRNGYSEETEIAQGLPAYAGGGWQLHNTRSRSTGTKRRRPPNKNQDNRDHQHQHCGRCCNHGAGKSEIFDRDKQQRHSASASKACAIEREADGHAAFAVEQQTERGGDDAEAGAGPAERKYRVRNIKLPGRSNLADHDAAGCQSNYTGEQAVARPEQSYRLAHESNQHRPEQIKECRSRRNQRGRPAVQAIQFGEVHALAIEAKRPPESRHQKADGDDAPALVSCRGFPADVTGYIHQCLSLEPTIWIQAPPKLSGRRPQRFDYRRIVSLACAWLFGLEGS